MTPRLRLFLVTLSIVVAALAMWLWLDNFNVSMADFRLLYERLQWWPLPFLFVFLAGHVALASWRWSIIEQGLSGQRPAFAHAFAAGGLALGLGTFLPAPVVNIACRSLTNRVNGMSSLRGALSGLADQLADLAVIALLAVPAAIALNYRDLGFFLGGALAATLLGLAIVIQLPKLVHTQYYPIQLQKAAPLFERSLLFKIYGISLLRVANLVVMTLAIHAAVGAASISAIVIGTPLITLAISIAMLPGAIGASEWSFSAVFSAYGIPKADIVIFVLANRVVLTGLSLLLMLIVLIAMARKLLVRPSA